MTSTHNPHSTGLYLNRLNSPIKTHFSKQHSNQFDFVQQQYKITTSSIYCNPESPQGIE